MGIPYRVRAEGPWYNPDIDTIYDAHHPAIATALAALNAALLATPPEPFAPAQGYRKGKKINFAMGERMEEWEVPFDLPDEWPATAAEPFAAYHSARQTMQASMDASISARAEPVHYLWNGSRRRFIPDFIVKLANGKTLILEIKGEDSPQDRAKRDALAEWVAAVNSAGGFGEWVCDVALEPAKVFDIIAAHSVHAMFSAPCVPA